MTKVGADILSVGLSRAYAAGCQRVKLLEMLVSLESNLQCWSSKYGRFWAPDYTQTTPILLLAQPRHTDSGKTSARRMRTQGRVDG